MTVSVSLSLSVYLSVCLSLSLFDNNIQYHYYHGQFQNISSKLRQQVKIPDRIETYSVKNLCVQRRGPSPVWRTNNVEYDTCRVSRWSLTPCPSQTQYGRCHNCQKAYHKYNMENPTTVRKLTINTTWTIPQLSESLPQIQHGQPHKCQKAYHKYNMDNPRTVRNLTTNTTWIIPQLSESLPQVQHGQSNNYQIAYHKYNMDNPTTVRKLTRPNQATGNL